MSFYTFSSFREIENFLTRALLEGHHAAIIVGIEEGTLEHFLRGVRLSEKSPVGAGFHDYAIEADHPHPYWVESGESWREFLGSGEK
jgi:hypothetical protein